MKRVKKLKRNRKKYELSERQLDKVKAKVEKKATHKALLIILGAISEKNGMTEKQLAEFGSDIARYTHYVENDMLRLKQIQDVVNKHSEFKITGF